MVEPKVIDGRGLMPPEPLELTLAALDTLPEGEELLLLLYCEPHPLYTILKQNGYRYRTGFRDDGTVEVYISKR
jgi:TusA-related sulfurtransferase